MTRIMSRRTADMLIHVAQIYRGAVDAGEPPLIAIATRLGITHRAAAQRVFRARAAGLLEATSKGRMTRTTRPGG